VEAIQGAVASYAATTGWSTHVVWGTPWEELQAVSNALAKRQGKDYKRRLTSRERDRKAAVLARARTLPGPGA